MTWNVGRRKMVVEEGAHIRSPILREHGADIVVQETIHHHPVESGQTPELNGSPVAKGFERPSLLKPGSGV
jgi:hypothetical protein